MSEIVDILKETQFDELLHSDLPILVDFWAPWCGPCKAMLPIVLTVAKQYAEKVIFAKVNIDQLPDIASRYQVGSIPYLVLFQEKSPIAELIGLQSQTMLSNFLEQHLNLN